MDTEDNNVDRLDWRYVVLGELVRLVFVVVLIAWLLIFGPSLFELVMS